MKTKLSKKEASEKVENFFKQKSELDPKQVKKIRRLAMKFKIKLGDRRKRFCRNCYSDLRKHGKVRLKKDLKNVECLNCGTRHRWKINSS